MEAMSKKELLEAICALDFTAVDLNLYLDTHPNDMRALQIYNQTVMQDRMLRHMYESQYGPLTGTMSPSAYPWQWINNPWPWDYSANL